MQVNGPSKAVNRLARTTIYEVSYNLLQRVRMPIQDKNTVQARTEHGFIIRVWLLRSTAVLHVELQMSSG